MKHSKFYALFLSLALLFASCGSMNNTGKGALIGGGGGAALGALVGGLIGHNAGGALIGAALGGTIGAGTGAIIGKRMDKVKQAAQQVANTQVEQTVDKNGLAAVKVTFDSGILFDSSKSDLRSVAQSSLSDFAQKVLVPNSDVEVAIYGYTDASGFKNKTAEESAQLNLKLSQERADAVKNYLQRLGVPNKQISMSVGYGQENPVADNSTKAGMQQNRRVEVYLYASKEMVEKANAAQ